MSLPKFTPCCLVHLQQDTSCVPASAGMKRAQHLVSFLHRQGMVVPACYKERDITPPLMRHFKKEESHLSLVIRHPLIEAFRGPGARTKKKNHYVLCSDARNNKSQVQTRMHLWNGFRTQ